MYTAATSIGVNLTLDQSFIVAMAVIVDQGAVLYVKYVLDRLCRALRHFIMFALGLGVRVRL